MNYFFVRIFNKVYFLILFVIPVLLMVNFSTFTLATNHNVVISLSRVIDEKDFFSMVAHMNCFITMWVSVAFVKKFIRNDIKNFSKQISYKRENIKSCLLTKVNNFDDNINCFLQLRI